MEALRNLAFWVLRARLLSDVEACLAGDAARRAGTAISGCLERLKDGARQANAGPVDRFIGGCLADAAVVLSADGLRQGPYLRTLFAVEVHLVLSIFVALGHVRHFQTLWMSMQTLCGFVFLFDMCACSRHEAVYLCPQVVLPAARELGLGPQFQNQHLINRSDALALLQEDFGRALVRLVVFTKTLSIDSSFSLGLLQVTRQIQGLLSLGIPAEGEPLAVTISGYGDIPANCPGYVALDAALNEPAQQSTGWDDALCVLTTRLLEVTLAGGPAIAPPALTSPVPRPRKPILACLASIACFRHAVVTSAGPAICDMAAGAPVNARLLSLLQTALASTLFGGNDRGESLALRAPGMLLLLKQVMQGSQGSPGLAMNDIACIVAAAAGQTPACVPPLLAIGKALPALARCVHVCVCLSACVKGDSIH